MVKNVFQRLIVIGRFHCNRKMSLLCSFCNLTHSPGLQVTPCNVIETIIQQQQDQSPAASSPISPTAKDHQRIRGRMTPYAFFVQQRRDLYRQQNVPVQFTPFSKVDYCYVPLHMDKFPSVLQITWRSFRVCVCVCVCVYAPIKLLLVCVALYTFLAKTTFTYTASLTITKHNFSFWNNAYVRETIVLDHRWDVLVW